MRYFLFAVSCVVPLHWRSFLIYCIYNRGRIKVIELEYRPWCNTLCQHGPWTETLFVHGTHWQVINTAGEHGLSVLSLTLSDSRVGDNDQTSYVDNNRSTLNCVVCLDWWKMYALVLLVILVVFSAVIPPSMLQLGPDSQGCYRKVRFCYHDCLRRCRSRGKAPKCSLGSCIKCSCRERIVG